MFTLEDTIALARKAHEGQKDKGDNPYINHPLRVMETVTTVEEKIVAVLHDVVEDTEISLADLQKLGLAENLIAALDCLTKREGESYEDFIRRAATNNIARKVKIADLQDNMDLARISNPTAKDYERMKKYKRAWNILVNH